jgi:hypothetical protein
LHIIFQIAFGYGLLTKFFIFTAKKSKSLSSTLRLIFEKQFSEFIEFERSSDGLTELQAEPGYDFFSISKFFDRFFHLLVR